MKGLTLKFSLASTLAIGLLGLSAQSNTAEAKAQSTVTIAKKVEKWITNEYCKKDRKCKTAAFKVMDKHCGKKWWEGCFFDYGRNGGKFKSGGDRKWLETKEYLDKKMK